MAESENLVAEIEALSAKLGEAKESIATRIIGQEEVVDLALTAMLSGGHALLMVRGASHGAHALGARHEYCHRCRLFRGRRWRAAYARGG